MIINLNQILNAFFAAVSVALVSVYLSVIGWAIYQADGHHLVLYGWFRVGSKFHVEVMTSFPIIFGYVCVFLYQNFFLTFWWSPSQIFELVRIEQMKNQLNGSNHKKTHYQSFIRKIFQSTVLRLLLACEYKGYKFWYSKVYEGDLLHVTRDKYVKNASFVYITE